MTALCACEATLAPPYQEDREPDDRTEYSGAEGLVQQQKDQNYLMRKELSDKCDKAKVDLAVAQTNNNSDAIKELTSQIKRVCI